ncbi:MAG: hypothetical protein F6K32_04695 [Desertifilum sp. SIO1I2]|nr:hypothetical protein [Desertifilum sp. SIO1I2]
MPNNLPSDLDDRHEPHQLARRVIFPLVLGSMHNSSTEAALNSATARGDPSITSSGLGTGALLILIPNQTLTCYRYD